MRLPVAGDRVWILWNWRRRDVLVPALVQSDLEHRNSVTGAWWIDIRLRWRGEIIESLIPSTRVVQVFVVERRVKACRWPRGDRVVYEMVPCQVLVIQPCEFDESGEGSG